MQRDSLDLLRNLNKKRLDVVGDPEIASRIKNGYDTLLAERNPASLTRDLGGTASTDQFAEALIAKLK